MAQTAIIMVLLIRLRLNHIRKKLVWRYVYGWKRLLKRKVFIFC